MAVKVTRVAWKDVVSIRKRSFLGGSLDITLDPQVTIASQALCARDVK